eukprot:11214578-Lingulodinium_polyedra.AAC.1
MRPEAPCFEGPDTQLPPPAGIRLLSAAELAAAPPSRQKHMIGERLLPAIARHQPELAGSTTGMMLEMDNRELLTLLESEQRFRNMIDE